MALRIHIAALRRSAADHPARIGAASFLREPQARMRRRSAQPPSGVSLNVDSVAAGEFSLALVAAKGGIAGRGRSAVN